MSGVFVPLNALQLMIVWQRRVQTEDTTFILLTRLLSSLQVHM